MSSGRKNAGKFQLTKRYQDSEPSVWNEYGDLMIEYEPLNLAHGFTDYAVPKYMTDTLAAVATGSDHMLNQYTRGFGHPRLIEALSALYSKLINRKIDPWNEVLVTSGAYEALYVTIQGHVGEGDEVIIIEPFFDAYEPMVKMAGGIPRYVQLRPRSPAIDGLMSSADWVFDDDELAAAFNEKTKAIILNTPSNPLGKVYSRNELTKIGDLCKKYDVLCISDEVYEWLIYDDNEHVRICSLPGMWERTITIGSAGKGLSVTGWKTGWAYGPADLIYNLQMVHQNSLYTCATPTQEAIAITFETELKRLHTSECYFSALPLELKAKRDYMVSVLKKIGMNVVVPQGTYFIMVDWSQLDVKIDLSQEPDRQKDFRFTKWMIKNIGLATIPPSVFYSQEHKSDIATYVRFCFFKKDEKLQNAEKILTNWVKK